MGFFFCSNMFYFTQHDNRKKTFLTVRLLLFLKHLNQTIVKCYLFHYSIIN